MRKRSLAMVTVALLGFASGLPLFLTGFTLKAWLTDAGLDLKAIGLFGLVAQPYALKFLWAGERGAERALADARAQAKVEHPSVVKVYETGRVEGLPFIAMQLVEGPPLASLRGRLQPLEAVRLLLQVAEGLEAAHAQGLAHLDLKPANILVDASRPGKLFALLSDFGLVSGPRNGGGSGKRGTPPFASPEQMGAWEALPGPLSDVYGLGACLHFLLGGAPPEPATQPRPAKTAVVWVALPAATN